MPARQLEIQRFDNKYSVFSFVGNGSEINLAIFSQKDPFPSPWLVIAGLVGSGDPPYPIFHN